MMARCPSCGGQVDDNDDVCPSCTWDFATRQRRDPSAAAKAPESSKKPPEPPKKPAEPAKKTSTSDDGTKPHSGKEIGRGLLQFPKIQPGQLRDASAKNEESPFAIPSFAKALPPAKEPPAAKPEAKPENKPEDDREERSSTSKEKFEPTPLAADLEEGDIPEPPKTVMRKREAPPPKPEAGRRAEPPKKKPASGPERKAPMGLYIGLASAAVLTIAGGGIYLLTRSGEPAAATHRAGRAFEEGATGATPAAQLPVVHPSPLERVPIKPVVTAPEPEPAPAPAPVVEKPQPKPKAKPAPAAAPKPVAPKPLPPPPAPVKVAGPEWKFQGTVFDLITLAPVVNVKLSFRVKDGREFTCQTDAKGRFKISVEPLAAGSYALSVSHKEYLDGYIDETSPPLAEAEADERRAIAASNVRNDPWIGEVKKSVKHDFYLIPYNLGKPAQ